jgi:hypothetical protein
MEPCQPPAGKFHIRFFSKKRGKHGDLLQLSREFTRECGDFSFFYEIFPSRILLAFAYRFKLAKCPSKGESTSFLGAIFLFWGSSFSSMPKEINKPIKIIK